jgi:enoyl-CoA hydratase
MSIGAVMVPRYDAATHPVARRPGREPGRPSGYGRTMPDALVEKDGHVLTVTMNRPVRYNAMTLQMFSRMADAWASASEDPDIRVCILTGAGGNFSSGMDLRAMSGDVDPTDDLDVTERLKNDTDYIYRGLLKTYRQIPYTEAADILLTGKHISASEAKQLGLVGHVVPDGQALTRAREIAAVIAANGPLAVEAILKTLHETEGMTEGEAFAYEREYGQAVFNSDDAKEGPRAFAEKRTPNFRRQ